MIHTPGEVSVSPYASSKTVPVAFCQRSATAFCTAIPPPIVSVSEPKSSFAKSGWFKSALNSVLTPVMTVNLCWASSFTKPGMSRGLVIKTLHPPIFMYVRQFPVREKM